MNTDACGFVASGYEAVADEFHNAFACNPTMGAALAIRVDGHPVVDLWGGLADARTEQPWKEDTASVVFSCTKGLSAILAARLVEEGRLAYEAPVARYWPEYAVAGKETTTVGDLLAHRAGLSAPRVDLTVDDVLDWQRMAQVLQEQQPLWQPGADYAYHAITHGWLIGQVMRNVTGSSVGEYFQKLVAGPLHADAWIGLPERQRDRIAHQTVGATLSTLVADQAAARDLSAPDWLDRAMTLGGAFDATLVGEHTGFNDYSVQAAEIPGAGGIATARALAAIWSATVTETDGVRLLSRDTTDAATRVQSEGAPFFTTEGPYSRWGMGFQLDSEARRYLTPQGFGHDGAGGQVAFAEPDLKVGFAFTTNLMEAGDARGTAIVNALRQTLGA